MGFVLLALFAFNEQATQGAIMQMICHGFSTGALFVLVGRLQELIHTRDISRMGGLWDNVPRMSGVTIRRASRGYEVHVHDIGNAEIRIVDARGKLVLTRRGRGGRAYRISRSKLSSGLNVVHVKVGSHVHVRRILNQ